MQQGQGKSSTQQGQGKSSTQQAQAGSSTQQAQAGSSTQQAQAGSSTQQAQADSSTQQNQQIPEGTCDGCNRLLSHCYNACLTGTLRRLNVHVSIPALDMVYRMQSGYRMARTRLITLANMLSASMQQVLDEFPYSPEREYVLGKMNALREILEPYSIGVDYPIGSAGSWALDEEFEIKGGKLRVKKDGTVVVGKRVEAEKAGAEGEVEEEEVGAKRKVGVEEVRAEEVGAKRKVKEEKAGQKGGKK